VVNLHNLRLGLTFDDVLLVPQRSSIRSRQDVNCETRFTTRTGLRAPIVAANMDTVTETEMAIALAALGAAGVIHRFMSIEVQAEMVAAVRAAVPVDSTNLPVAAAVGTDHDAIDRSAALADAGANVLVLDIAHGHADHALEAIGKIKAEVPGCDVIAGNVATRRGAEELVAAGADAIKVGVGPGGVCTTRLVAGVGVPQLTAIADCAGVEVPVIADGGIRTSGDIVKALAAGADSVMVGSMFAGTKESPGSLEQSDHGLVKRVRGMASFEAIEARAERSGESIDDEYFEQRAPEGVEGVVAYRGEVRKLVGQLMAGLRSGMSYSDARSVPELWEKAEFIQVTASGVNENRPHATLR